MKTPQVPSKEFAEAHVEEEKKNLLSTVKDKASRKNIDSELSSFARLFKQYLTQKESGKKLDWDRIKPPDTNEIVPYEKLPSSVNAQNLSKLAVLKVNGGLGTSMGMAGAKSALEVKDEMTFLDVTVRQIEVLNTEHHLDVSLVLMTSFHTQEDTLRVIKKYANQAVRITTFNQSRYPRIHKESLTLCPKSIDDDNDKWYPPGHGDLYTSLVQSGLLGQLLAEGKEYLFVSNSDNLGATVDERILQYMVDNGADFVMQITPKSRTDIQGGTLVDYDGHIQLLELDQVPFDHVEDFKSVKRFNIFNTNNLWINLRALNEIMSNGGMELDLIVKQKTAKDSQEVLQLETAAGSAIKHFRNAHGVVVPRSRFLPVKTCSDLLLIRSDIYSLQSGRLLSNPSRMFQTVPVIKLGEHFRTISEFQQRFKRIPNILDLDHLTVTGDVWFGRNVILRGTVIIVANEGQRIDIPDGTMLENRLVSGNLNMIEL